MEFLSPEFIKVILNAGLSVVLALVVIYWYRSDSLDQLRQEKDRSEQERNDKILILDILKENTNALTNNSNAIERVLEICNKINDKITRNQKDV
ncbi:MAG: hypothetical protein AB7V50_04895 [Vampirovibrionia bacterium]